MKGLTGNQKDYTMDRAEYPEKRAFIGAALMNLAALILFAVFIYPYFETNDDATIRFFVDGTKIISDYHLVYQNVILGRIYMLLYAVTRRFPWYSIFMWAVIFLCLCAVTYVLLCRVRGAGGYVLSGFLILWFGHECYCRMQYTKVAGLCAGAGMLLIYHAGYERLAGQGKSADRKTVRALETAGGLLIGSLGAMYRFPMFLVGAFLTTGIPVSIMIEMLRNRRRSGIAETDAAGTGEASADGAGTGTSGKEAAGTGASGKGAADLRSFLRCVILPGLAMLLISLALFGVDRLHYRSQRWKEYDRFNAVRTELLDYGLPGYKKYRKHYKAAGIDKNAFELLEYWNFADPDVFTAERLEEIAGWKKDNRSFGTLLSGFVRRVPVGLTAKRTLYCLLGCLIAWLFARRKRWEQAAGMFWSLACFVLVYFSLYRRGRYLFNRVDTFMLFALCLTVLWMIREVPFSAAAAGFVMSLALMRIVAGAGVMPVLRGSEAETEKEYAKIMQQNRLMEAAGDNEHLYLFTFQTLSDDDSFGPFDMATPGCMDNLLWLGGWGAYTDIYYATMDRWNISNPYRDMVDNEDIYLVDVAVGDRLNYLNAYYGFDVEAEKVGNLGQFPVYRIVTVTEESALLETT